MRFAWIFLFDMELPCGNVMAMQEEGSCLTRMKEKMGNDKCDKNDKQKKWNICS